MKIFQFFNMENGDLTGNPCVMADKFFFVVDKNMIMEVRPKQVFLDENVVHEVNIEEVSQQYEYQVKYRNLNSKSISTINGVTFNYLNSDLHLLLSAFTSWVVSNN